MCNLYSQTKSQDAMRHLFDDMVEGDEELVDSTGNLPPQPGIWPDYPAPIIRHGESAAWQLAMARWGMPTPAKFLEGKRTDKGVTNIRNVGSPHWRRWLGVEHRCLVPFTSFSEIDGRRGAPRNSPVWFALDEDRPLAFFAGLQILDLSDNRLAGVAPLAALPGLRQLYVQGNALRGGLGLPPGAFAGLDTLDASFNALGPEALAPLAALPRLRKLDLGGNAAVGPAFPAALPPGGFPALEDLGLASCGLAGAALGALAGLPRLRALGLHGNPRVEAWPAECARAGSFADLRVLDVSACGVALLNHLEGAWRLPKLTQLLAWGNSGCVLRAGADFRAAGCHVVLAKPGAPQQRPNLRQFFGDKRLPPMSEDVSLGQDMGFSFLERRDIEGVFARIRETLEDFGEEIAEEDVMEARQYAPPPSDGGSSSASSSDGEAGGSSSEGEEAGAGGPGGAPGFLASLAGPSLRPGSRGGARGTAKSVPGDRKGASAWACHSSTHMFAAMADGWKSSASPG